MNTEINLEEIKKRQEEFYKYRLIGRKVAELLHLHSDRLGFHQTTLGMKTEQGIGFAIADIVEKELDKY